VAEEQTRHLKASAATVTSPARDDNEERPDELSLPEYVTREQLREHLVKLGYPITAGTLSQLCAPSRGEGPEIAGYWGQRPIYRLETGIAWARARLRHKPYRVHPLYGKKRKQASADA
jgi:hypothetical protein